MARRPRFTIPTRIFLGFVLVLCVFAAMAVTSVVEHQRNARTLRILREGYLPLSVKLLELKAEQRVHTRLLERLHDEQNWAGPRALVELRVARRGAELGDLFEDLQDAEGIASDDVDLVTLDRIRAELEAVERSYQQTGPNYGALFRVLRVRDRDYEQVAESLRDLRAEEIRVNVHFDAAWNELERRVSSVGEQAREQQRQASFLLGILSLLVLGVGVVVTWWSMRVLKPLPLLQQRVVDVAEGKLDSSRLLPETDDELGRLATEFERMVDALSARDAHLRAAADAQRALQRMQEQIVSGLRAAILVLDGDGVLRTVNPAARAVLGIDERAVGRPIDATGLFERLPGMQEAVDRVASGVDRAVLEAAELAGDPRRRVYVLVTPFGSDDASGGRSVLVVAEDVTEELETKRRLIQTERLAAIGRMAAHVTHEVRNPLSSIGLNVEMLEEELSTGNSEARGLLKAIQKEIDRLTSITEEYLRLARLPQPRLEADDFGEVARSVTQFVKAEMAAAGVELRVEIAAGLPPVAMDEAQIRQALLNLLRNAREAMPGGGPASLEVERQDGGVAVRVKDGGPGIPPGERERIFDLFYTTKERGTGLGLPLTQQIVVAHGGRIRCDATPGEGTTFELWFPAAPAREAPPRGQAEAGAEGARRTA